MILIYIIYIGFCEFRKFHSIKGEYTLLGKYINTLNILANKVNFWQEKIFAYEQINNFMNIFKKVLDIIFKESVRYLFYTDY